MIIYKSCLRVILSLFALLVMLPLQALELYDPETALQQYVDYEDNTFNMQHIVSIPGAGYHVHLYNLTSQEWLTDVSVDRSIWTHSLVIVVPDEVQSTTALLFVGGEKNTDPLPDGSDPTVQVITQIALGSKSITSAIFQVPNQPIIFEDNGIPTKEDLLVATSWDNVMDTANFTNSAYLPMVKSVVKAMDGVQSVIADQGNYQIDDFVLTGFSKRGATVWLTAAIDKRIRAIAPGVIDFLNMIPSFEHHYKSYGTFSTAVQDYVDLGITDKLRSPEFKELSAVIDPYAYLDQLTMPKYLLNSTGDQFFLPDSSRFYFDDLKGETMIRFAPNTDHSLSNSVTGIEDSLYSLLGWYQSVLYGVPRPVINWKVSATQLQATTNQTPVAVKVWTAYNANSRDFRKETIGEAWTSSLLPVSGSGEYAVTLPQGTDGFHATFIEFIYTGLAGLPVTYSTQVYVTPDTYLFTLDDPVLNPHPAHYWALELHHLLYGNSSSIPESTWLSYLPLPVLGDIQKSLSDLEENLYIMKMPTLDKLAKRECLATRLNIASGESGWYSMFDLGYHLGNKPLWEHYQLAHDYAQTLPLLSSYICHQLNTD